MSSENSENDRGRKMLLRLSSLQVIMVQSASVYGKRTSIVGGLCEYRRFELAICMHAAAQFVLNAPRTAQRINIHTAQHNQIGQLQLIHTDIQTHAACYSK